MMDVTERRGNHDSVMAPHDCYKAAGDSEKWVSIAVGTEPSGERCQAMANRSSPTISVSLPLRCAKRNEAIARPDDHQLDERTRSLGGDPAATRRRGRLVSRL